MSRDYEEAHDPRHFTVAHGVRTAKVPRPGADQCSRCDKILGPDAVVVVCPTPLCEKCCETIYARAGLAAAALPGCNVPETVIGATSKQQVAEVHDCPNCLTATCSKCNPEPFGEAAGDAYAVALEVEVHTLRQRAVRAHQICNMARLTYPEIGELADDGCLHEAIHDVLRVGHALATTGKLQDGCTESNCRRCLTHPDHRGDIPHAGIGTTGRQQVGEVQALIWKAGKS